MNWSSILSTFVPLLLKLLSDPTFQSIITAIETNLTKQVASGTPPATASQQATGLLGALAMLHLTGNPVADFEAFLQSLSAAPAKPTPAPVKPATPPVGGFTS